MPRIVSVWLPRWPVQRFLASERKSQPEAPVDPNAPFVLTAEGAGGLRVAALNAAAERLGIIAGEGLADARSRTGISQIRPADPAKDAAALGKLALWATRYAPAVATFADEYGADGLFIDITGAAHLFGGEEKLLDDLAARLKKKGLQARLAIAGTAGAAWALSRFRRQANIVLPSGKEAAALAPLPVAGLRLSPDTARTLRRLGLKKIGALIASPRSPLGARFEKELMLRLDQALGRAPETLRYVSPPPVFHRRRNLLEPIATADAVLDAVKSLAENLAPELERSGKGVRAFRLALHRVDGETVVVDVGLTLPTRSAAHLVRLLALKLERLDALADAGFGFETVSLLVTNAERMTPRQEDFAPAQRAKAAEQQAALVDRLRQRLGSRNVRWIEPVESHIPERSERTAASPGEKWRAPKRLRPLLLLYRAEPANVVALVPEGPPKRFRWRGRMRPVLRAEGPERIADEWWRSPSSTRDYYIVEDDKGRRYWLYRDGLYGRETASPRWFVHGFFA